MKKLNVVESLFFIGFVIFFFGLAFSYKYILACGAVLMIFAGILLEDVSKDQNS